MGLCEVGNDDTMVLLDWPADRILHHEDMVSRSLPQFLAEACLRRGLGVPQAPSEATISGSVEARVDGGRWIALCPSETCRGAEMVSVHDPVFVCASCCNRDNGGRWYAVTFPANKAAIETELLRRPSSARIGELTVTRGWAPGQSIAALRRERQQLEARA